MPRCAPYIGYDLGTPHRAGRKGDKGCPYSGYDARATDDLGSATLQADIISCYTLSWTTLIKGVWVKPGAHIDLIGAFKPEMPETDSTLIATASVFADTREGVLLEGGDIVQAIREGSFDASDIKADLFDLARGYHAGRRFDDEITVFKFLDAALEDLAAAILTYESTATTL
jgi:ornithine cyclodeaminase